VRHRCRLSLSTLIPRFFTDLTRTSQAGVTFVVESDDYLYVHSPADTTLVTTECIAQRHKLGVPD
jgi:hypothetical protein